MTARIDRVFNGNHMYKVYADEKYVDCFPFELDAKETSCMYEPFCLAEAKALAAKIEAAPSFPIVETIYQTNHCDPDKQVK